MRRVKAVSPWLVAATWVGWPWLGRYLFHRLIHGGLEMRADPAGNDVEYLVYSPMQRIAFWLLVAGVPLAVTAIWWYMRRRPRPGAAPL